jgi:autotransporter translocation and assembly factor TamB
MAGILLLGWYLVSGRFEEYVQAQLVARVSSASGMDCSIRSLELDLLRGRFLVDGFSLQPRAGTEGPLQLAIRQVGGAIRLPSILGWKLSLAELTVIEPRLIIVTRRGGQSWNPDALLRTFKTSLDLSVGRATVVRGSLELNGERRPLELRVDNFICQIRYRASTPAYGLRLAYKNGRLTWGNRELVYDLDARALVSMDGIRFDSIQVAYRSSRLQGSGSMQNWQEPAFRFQVAGKVAAQDLSLFHSLAIRAHGEIDAQADLRWDSTRGITTAGKFSIPSGRYGAASITRVRGDLELARDVLHLRNVTGRVHEGTVQADVTLQLWNGGRSTPHRLDISVENVALADVGGVLNLPAARLQNRVDASAKLKWRRGLEDLSVTGNAMLHPAPPQAAQSGTGTGLGGRAEFSYDNETLVLHKAALASDFTDIHVSAQDGRVFHVRMSTTRIAEPLSLVRGFVPLVERTLARYPDILEISGKHQLEGNVTLERGGVAYEGQVVVQNGIWRSYRLDSLTGRASWDGHVLKLTSLEGRRGTEEVAGALGITLGEQSDSTRLQFTGRLRGVSLDSLEDLGVDLKAEVAGIVSGKGSVTLDQGRWSGEGEFSVEGARLAGESFDLVNAEARLDDKLLRITNGTIRRGAAQVTLQGEIRVDSREMKLSSRLSDLPLQEIPAVRERGLDIGGLVTGSGQIGGTPENPSFEGKFRLTGLRYGAWDLGQGQGTVNLQNRGLRATASVQSELGGFEAQAAVSTESGLPGKAMLEFRDWNIHRLVSSQLPLYLGELSTALRGNLELEGKFAEPDSLSYRGELDGARLKVHDYELRNDGKIRFTSVKGKLQVADVRMLGDGTSLVLSGEIPVNGDSGLNLRLTGTLSLKVAENIEKRARVSGSAAVDVRATGSMRDPQVIGQARLNDARLEFGELPFHFSSMRGTAVFSRNLVRLEGVQGSVATGTIGLSGAFELEKAQLRGVNLQISVRRARVPYPRDFRSTVNADLVLRGTRDAQVLTGVIDVLRSDYLREFSLLEQLANRGPGLSGPQVTDPILAGLRLNVSINSDGGLFIDNELTRMQGGMRLTLRGSPAYPSLTGRVEATEGTIFFRGNRFEIIRGAADFIDRNRINPVLDIRAEADVRSYRLLLDIAGDLDHLNVNLTSDPPMSMVDIVSLLTTGKSRDPGDESSRRQAEITGLSAASILSESLTGVIGKRVQRLFGFESFRVDPFLAGAENDPTARVTITERVSKDVTITFSRNLSTNEEQIVILEYDVTRNLSIVATRDEDGKFGLDFRFRKRFR